MLTIKDMNSDAFTYSGTKSENNIEFEHKAGISWFLFF